MALPQRIEISHRTIIFTILLGFFLWLVIQIRDIILLLFISFILMSALRPLVDWLEERRVPRVLAILFLYLIGLTALGVVTTTIIPPLVSQSARFANQLPRFLTSFFSLLNITGINIESITSQLGPITQQVFRITIGIFNNIFATLSLLVFTFYFLLERKHLKRYLAIFLGEDASNQTVVTIYQVEDRLGAWVRGQLLLMLIVALASFIGLALLRLEFALPLALIAGILEIVPVVGPIVSAIPAVIVALATSSSPILALAVIGLYFIIQQLENNLVVPLIMRRAIGLPPVVTLIALMIGGRIGGVIGAILAVPVVVMFQVIITEAAGARKRKPPQ